MSTAVEAGPKRVVIADDDADIRVLIAIAARKAGLVVVAEESDGVAALDAVRRVQPDLAILDVSMPAMTGIEVCRTVRGDTSLDSVRLVLLSAGADDRARGIGLASGADHYLIKPFSPKALAVTLAEMMGHAE
ncbi:response regulator [Glaciihabitans sp. GrIS 2.15]|uniref:response regulator n=1 Tax=Glaciihabitans sp. GrIS 2.15 TaxID=3071710 RepID=UPI002E0E20D0